MQVRTYRARSLQEALMMVQTELGPDTRVVQTRELQTGLWERWTQGRQFEIRTRRPGANTLPLRRHGEPRVSAETPQLGGLADAAFEIRKQKAPAPMTSPMPNTTANGGTLKSTFTAAPTSNPPVFPTHSAAMTPARSEPNNQWATSAWFELLTDLIEAEIPAEAARALVEQLRQTVASVTPTLGDLRQAAAELLMNEVTLSGPISVPVGGRRIVAMVGPTGVGKTTTIAKLAAHFRLREQRRVGLITVDTFRVAAVEQLRTYAEIMDMRLEVVSTPREMRDAVARLADCELILIDTAGRGPDESLPLQQLKSLLAEAGADEVQLVVSAVSSSSHLRKIGEAFGPLGVSSLLVTKIDETMALGGLLPVLRQSGLPVGYLACGQNVPDDIVVAPADRWVKCVLGQLPVSTLHE